MTVEISRLNNGLRIVTHAMPHLETASLGVWVNAGARAERENEHGVSHLLEHMAFKGTRRRSARDIAEEIENVGGDINAATAAESTAYYARVLKEDVPLAVDILGDILQNSVFDPAELKREQNVIVQEIGAANDTPDDLIFDMAQDAAFPGQAIGRSILGTPQTVRGFRPDHLNAFLSERYRGPGMILAAAGAVDHDAIVKLAGEHLAGIGPQPAPDFEPARYEGGEARLERPLEQAHLVLGFKGISYLDGDFYAAQMLSGILGGGMSSRLFQQVREKRGLCYSVYAFHWTFRDTGLFGVYAATGEAETADLPMVIADELLRAATDIGDAEVARARAQLKAGLMMSLESSAARAEQIARQEMVFGRVVPVSEMLDRVEAVTSADLRRVAKVIVGSGPLTLSAIGPLKRLASRDQIQTRLRSG